MDVHLADDYEFGTLLPSIKVLSADIPTFNLVCLSFEVTPIFGTAIDVTFSIVPLAIALLVGFATLFAAVYNPWTGTTDLLRATSNYGQDPDALRLVTPGISDIWYYLQFAVYTACLSLNYPGFYQPVLSRVGWSNLLFNTTLLHPNGGDYLSWSTVTTSLSGQVDPEGPYLINVVNGSDYGLTQYASLVGISAQDVWPTFMVWFLLVLAGVTILTEIAFGLHWLYKHTTSGQAVDFGTRNVCFLGGMILRIWSMFYIVLVTLSCYQIVVTGQSPKFQVGLSIVCLIILGILAPALLFWIISRYSPREYLYDDLHVLLFLGPLYNTYQSSGLLFVGFHYSIRLLQGIVIGAAQASGIAQITLLAGLEVFFLVAINVWRPYNPRTSMNGWHTFMAVMRLIVILFLIAFIPSLNVDPGVRGWIGYTLLVIHAAILVFVFVLNVFLTIVEIAARLVGAGEDSARREREFGLANVFGINQLMKRGNSTHHRAELVDEGQERKSREMTLAQRRLSRNSSQEDSSGYGLMDAASFPSRGSTPGGVSAMASSYNERRNTMSPVSAHSGTQGYFPRSGTQVANNGSGNLDISSPALSFNGYADTNYVIRPAYYRPPRRSHGGLSPLTPTTNLTSRASSSFDPPATRADVDAAVRGAFSGGLEEVRRPTSRADSPRPVSRNEAKPRPDYAVREADAFYYRRPDYSQPLNPGVSTGRRLGTGPADPTGPVAIASSWLGRLFRPNPEKGKFEVVRGNAARATEIPLTEKPSSKDASDSGTAGKGDDSESPLVDSNDRFVEEDDPQEGPLARPVLSQVDIGQHSTSLLRNSGSALADDCEDDLTFPLPPPKHPARGSVSSFEEIPPSIPRKSSARASPRIVTDIPWQNQEERVLQVKTGRPVWTEHHDGSKESFGEVRDSRGSWGSEEE